mmetsp:Transcript_8857/g.22933  ORF Transcript_8857/g.22933 Transcript_8857/m.22933 type:complete len:211 (-) Transcript_8857:2009-2641(-)
MRLHVQGDELADVAELDDDLLCVVVVLVLAEALDSHLQQHPVDAWLPDNVDKAVQGPDLHEDLHGLAVLSCGEVHLARRSEVAILFRGSGLLQDETLGDRVLGDLFAPCGFVRNAWLVELLALLSPVLRLVPLPEFGEHLDGHIVLLRPAEMLGCLTVLALKSQHLRCHELLLLVGQALPVAVLLRDPVQQVDVLHVPDSDKSLSRDVEA